MFFFVAGWASFLINESSVAGTISVISIRAPRPIYVRNLIIFCRGNWFLGSRIAVFFTLHD